MGQTQFGALPGQTPGDKKDKKDDKKEKKKYEPAAPPTRVGRKQRRHKGPEAAARLPVVTPVTKCKLRLLKLERVKDYLLMEEEYVTNQERLKPQEEKNEEDRTKVDDLRGTPMSVGNLEEIIDENHAIVSSSTGPEYYVNILSFVDKDQLEPGCSILLHNKVNPPLHGQPSHLPILQFCQFSRIGESIAAPITAWNLCFGHQPCQGRTIVCRTRFWL